MGEKESANSDSSVALAIMAPLPVGIILEFARHLCVDIVDKSLDTIEGTVVGPVLVTIRSFVVIQIGAACKGYCNYT